MIAGRILDIRPDMLVPGSQLNVYVDIQAFTDNTWASIRGWKTKLIVYLNNREGENAQFYMMAGGEVNRIGERILLGVMPNHDVTGRVRLVGDEGEMTYPWYCDERTFTIKADKRVIIPSPITPIVIPVSEPEPTPEPEPEPFALPDWAIPAGIALVALAFLVPGRKR